MGRCNGRTRHGPTHQSTDVDTRQMSTYIDTMTTESDLTTAASASDPRVGLRAVRALRRLLEELERTQVRRARAKGWSWAEIGDALEVSRQAVHKKHGKD